MRPLSELLLGRGADRGGDARSSSHAWMRWAWVWDVIFYALLALALGSSLSDGEFDGGSRLAVVVLCLAWGGWYWFMVIRHPWWIQQARPILIYITVAMALGFALISIHPAYQMLNFAIYLQIFSLLPMRWAIPASIFTTGFLILRSIAENPEAAPALLLTGAATLAVGTFFALWIDSIINQSEERHNLIEELERTRKELAAEERRAGVLEERGRLAREIHDTLAQGFVSIVAHLEAAEETLDPEDTKSRRHLDQARATARENLVEARHLVAALRPEILEGSSLSEALERLTERWSEETGVPATLAVTGEERPLPQEAQVALLRATQEALANARKHARASRVTATLSYMDDVIALDVQDDGEGFDPEGVSVGAERGFGLRAMRERVEALGGGLLVESARGEGSTLVVELPVREPGTPDGRAEEGVEAERGAR